MDIFDIAITQFVALTAEDSAILLSLPIGVACAYALADERDAELFELQMTCGFGEVAAVRLTDFDHSVYCDFGCDYCCGERLGDTDEPLLI